MPPGLPGTRLAALLTAAVTLLGCSAEGPPRSDGSLPAVQESGTPGPTLEPAWSMPGQFSTPQASGRQHWAVHRVPVHGQGRSALGSSGPLLTVDARTGRVRRSTAENQRFACAMPALVADDGTLPVLWATYQPDAYTGQRRTEPCTRLTVHDAAGKVLWARTLRDAPGSPDNRVLGAQDGRVALVGPLGERVCLARADGARIDAAEDHACRMLADRLDRTDLPPLLLPDGTSVPYAGDLWDERRIAELGRTDEVIVLRTERTGRAPVVRAHDLTTGSMLWERADPAQDPHPDDTWNRQETWASTPTRVLHISYAHPEDPDDVASTPMRISEVDPRTGEDLRALGVAAGAWFNRQVGEVTVALTEQQRGLRSTISGFVLPPS